VPALTAFQGDLSQIAIHESRRWMVGKPSSRDSNGRIGHVESLRLLKTSVNHPSDWSSRGYESLYHADETDLSSFLHEISVLSIDENAHSSDPLSPVSR